MAIRVALNHHTLYRYDRPVTLSPQIVRLRPAPHCRTPVTSYSLRVEPQDHFLNWQQDPQSNWLARLVFPKPVTCFGLKVDLTAELSVINPFDFFLEESARHFPFPYEEWLSKELAPFLQTLPMGPLLAGWLERVDRREFPTVDFLVALNQRLANEIRYLIRMEPGVQSCEETLERGSVLSVTRGVTGRLQLAVATDGSMRAEIRYPGRTEVRVLAGGLAWNGGARVQELSDETMADSTRLQFHRLTAPFELVSTPPESLEALGESEEGWVRVRRRWGERLRTVYEIEGETGRIRRVRGEMSSGESRIEFVSEDHDFRRVSGVLFPFRTTTVISGRVEAETVLFDRWRLNVSGRELIGGDGVAMPLSTAEFQLLSAFVNRPRMVLSRDQLLDHLTLAGREDGQVRLHRGRDEPGEALGDIGQDGHHRLGLLRRAAGQQDQGQDENRRGRHLLEDHGESPARPAGPRRHFPGDPRILPEGKGDIPSFLHGESSRAQVLPTCETRNGRSL